MVDTNSDNVTLIETFYTAFQQRDYAAMNSCYHDDAHFFDPVFTDLYGNEVKAMWHMLCERGKDLQITFSDVRASEYIGTARWEAVYTFSTGRKVHNLVFSEFKFDEGKIKSQRDYFDLWRWSRMALGFSGLLLGWTPTMQNKIRTTAVNNLQKFIADHPEYQ